MISACHIVRNVANLFNVVHLNILSVRKEEQTIVIYLIVAMIVVHGFVLIRIKKKL